MYFSEELFNAEAYGYTFKIKKGYLFENELIFSEYINDLNAIKEVSEKDSVDYLTSKFLMNSLYGKFGMNPNKDSHLIINNGFIDRLYLKSDIVDLIDFQNGHSLVSVKKDQEESIANINVSIASAVTAYARILMSDYKLGLSDKGYSIYYTDTDSIDLNKPLPDNLVSSKELGKMKLENIFKKVVYLAPKLYAAISDKGEILKSKGLKESIKYHELFSLLLKGKEKIVYQDK
jgi:DNA polymerase elongation subunit (family B)